MRPSCHVEIVLALLNQCYRLPKAGDEAGRDPVLGASSPMPANDLVNAPAAFRRESVVALPVDVSGFCGLPP